LSQVYGIVKQHQGFIDVETEPGVGTTFHAYLPVFEAGQAEEMEEISPVTRGRGEMVLLVEDHEDLREAGRQVLEAQGYRPLTAANGRDALEMLEGIVVDLVITDVVMPDMGGEALMLALREMYPDLPVLAVTGYTLQGQMQELRRAGFTDVLQKPIDAPTLAQALRRALDGV
jgi:CheY-like chemotaxis protein